MTPTILARLQAVKKTKTGWQAKCPAHEDRQASLSVSITEDGKTLIHCFAGCTVEAVVEAVGMRMPDLGSPNGNGQHKPERSSGRRIVSAYDYVDEAGTLLYQAVRYEPKDFRQRRPAPGGGWEWKLDGTRRVLYRLPELIAADPDQTVFVCEGEKDVDRLRGLGLVATTNCGGAGKWRPEYSQHLAGRRVAILPDQDQPGQQHAEQVAKSLSGTAAEIRIVQLPGLGAKQDVSDWLSGGGTVEGLRQIVSEAAVWTETTFADHVEAAQQRTRDKTPVKAPPAPWRPFPVEALPQPIRDYAVETAAAIGCDVAFTATVILPCLAGAVGITRAIRLNDRWTEPSVLWCGIVGPSGCHKSPALDEATRHVKRRQAEQFEDFAQARSEYEAAVESHKLALDEWKRTGRKNNEPQPTAPIEPSCQRSYVSDITIEGLGLVLVENQRGTILIRDELSGWFNAQNEYKGGKGSDREKWLSIFGARDLLSDRKTGDRKTIYVRRAAVSIVGGVQPETLRRVFTAESFETGLAARWLLCCPPRRERRWNEVRIDWTLDQQVAAVFDRLYHLSPNGLENQHEPVVLDLAPAAKDRWVEFYNHHGDRITNSDGAAAALLSKIEGSAARLSLIIHLVRQAAGDRDTADDVDERSVEAGVRIAEWYGDEGLRLYTMFSESDEDRQRRELIELIQRHGGTVTPRQLQRSSRRYATADEADQALTELVNAGLGSFDVVSGGTMGGRPSCRFSLTSNDKTSEIVGKQEVLSTSAASAAGKTHSENYVSTPISEILDTPPILCDEWEEIEL